MAVRHAGAVSLVEVDPDLLDDLDSRQASAARLRAIAHTTLAEADRDARGHRAGIDSLDVSADASAFVRRYRISYPMLRDRDGDTQRRFGVTGYPETLVVDPRGRIAALRRGPVDDAFLRAAVLPLLKERA
jgi:hypothetical protein